MGENRLFWPQEMMDEWVVDEKAVIEEDVLTIVEEQKKYRIRQAVLFVTDVGDGQDSHSLLGRVKEVETLVSGGAEHYMDSVIIKDSAYQVVQGFTGVPVVNRTAQAAATGIKGDNIAGAVKTRAGETDSDDKELLANFLLNNL